MGSQASRSGVLLYGPPASGKDTVTAALTKYNQRHRQFERLKVGSGKSAGYRMGSAEQLAELEAAGDVVYSNSRYGNTYVVDRPGLDAAFEVGVPVAHLGQVDGVRALLDDYQADWLSVLLWCPREVTAERSAGRGDEDTLARLSAWDATQADLDTNQGFRFDLVIQTDTVSPERAAELIARALAFRAQLLMVDFDDTLIDRRAAVSAWITSYCAGANLVPAAERRMLEAMGIRADLATFEALQSELGLAEPAADLWARYSAELAAAVAPFPGVLDALDAVRAEGWQVVIVTNGGGQIQRAKLKSSGISDRVDAICISEEVGARKPDPVVFEAAAASVGRALDQGGWMIGDNAELDIIGGRGAGLHTIWISHGRPWPGGAEPDVIAETAVDAFAHVRGRGDAR
ncbi:MULTISPECIES: HAD family hydrolase [unclassified Kitasatospora]|uniref:HAD family hydrolase n=1 Tax=unclassified Kitasatospora TaxID=2633591 RepID=UPI0033FA9506